MAPVDLQPNGLQPHWFGLGVGHAQNKSLWINLEFMWGIRSGAAGCCVEAVAALGRGQTPGACRIAREERLTTSKPWDMAIDCFLNAWNGLTTLDSSKTDWPRYRINWSADTTLDLPAVVQSCLGHACDRSGRCSGTSVEVAGHSHGHSRLIKPMLGSTAGLTSMI